MSIPPPKPTMATRSKTWAMDLIRKHMPTREQMASNRYLAPIAHRFLSPELWRFTRRSLPFWLVVANRIGEFFLRFDAAGATLAKASASGASWEWLTMIYEVGLSTVLGGVVLALVSPVLGWLISGWVWRAVVSRKRAKRLKAMEARLDRRLGAR